MNQNKYNMIDNGAGLCAGIATYQVVKNTTVVKMTHFKGNSIVRLGLELLEAYAGIQVGIRVREQVYTIRTNYKKMKEEEKKCQTN